MPPLTDESFVRGYELEIGATRYRQAWRGVVDVPIDRVRALAFTDDGEMLLVEGDLGLQLPGGGVEGGESPSEALQRELWEEADATIASFRRMGALQIDVVGGDPAALVGSYRRKDREFHDFYCCRISLGADWSPNEEISSRVTVPPEEFLDALHWGRSDPKAAFLLERSLQMLSSL